MIDDHRLADDDHRPAGTQIGPVFILPALFIPQPSKKRGEEKQMAGSGCQRADDR